MEKVSTTPSDRGRSISSLRVPYVGDKVQVVIEDMVFAEKHREVTSPPSDRGRSISSPWVAYEGDKVQFIIEDMVLVENIFRVSL